jgi:hypothetical protein
VQGGAENRTTSDCRYGWCTAEPPPSGVSISPPVGRFITSCFVDTLVLAGRTHSGGETRWTICAGAMALIAPAAVNTKLSSTPRLGAAPARCGLGRFRHLMVGEPRRQHARHLTARHLELRPSLLASALKTYTRSLGYLETLKAGAARIEEPMVAINRRAPTA